MLRFRVTAAMTRGKTTSPISSRFFPDGAVRLLGVADVEFVALLVVPSQGVDDILWSGPYKAVMTCKLSNTFAIVLV